MTALVILLPWWVSILVAVVTAPAMVPLVRGIDRHLARRVAADAEIALAEEREETRRTRARNAADRGAFERAFELKADEHRECIEEVKGLRDEVVRNRDEIADVRVALARCEEQHVRSAMERNRDRTTHRTEMDRLRAEIARVDRKTDPSELEASPGEERRR